MSGAERNPDQEARRGQILEAAFVEFSTKGYAGASTAAIARRAQASKETLYAWFGNKEGLFNILFESRLDGMNSRVSVTAETDPSPANVLPVVAEDVIRFMLAFTPLIQALGVGAATDRALRRIGQTIQEERGRFADYLLRCRDQDLVAFDEDALELVSLFVAMAEGEWSLRLATGMIDGLTDQMIAEHAQRVTRIFLKGIAP